MKNKKIDLIEDEIISIELVGEADTMDIEVDDVHMFFANDIYTHNSGFSENTFGVEAISESIGKAQTADVIIGIGRTPEDKRNRVAKMNIMKNRQGSDGNFLDMHFDTSNLDIRIIQGETSSKVGMIWVRGH